MAQLSMADLLAKQDKKISRLIRGQEIEGEVISILDNEIILDLGVKAEGLLLKKDLTQEQIDNFKIGDKLTAFVIYPENDSGQVILSLNKLGSRGPNSVRFARFEQALKNHEVLTGRVLELNRGGLIVEAGGIRGFLPSSQIVLSQANNLADMVGKDIKVNVIEVDQGQNRLIFSQVIEVSAETKELLNKIKMGDQVKAKIFSVLPFGLAVKLDNGLEGFVHISEVAWEKIEDPAAIYKEGDEVEAKVTALDQAAGRVNLSIKQLRQDPFNESVKKFQPDDVVKGTVKEISQNGVVVSLSGDIEGLISTVKLDSEHTYSVGEIANFVVDSIDERRRRVNLVPFITSTAGLIYK